MQKMMEVGAGVLIGSSADAVAVRITGRALVRLRTIAAWMERRGLDLSDTDALHHVIMGGGWLVLGLDADSIDTDFVDSRYFIATEIAGAVARSLNENEGEAVTEADTAELAAHLFAAEAAGTRGAA